MFRLGLVTVRLFVISHRLIHVVMGTLHVLMLAVLGLFAGLGRMRGSHRAIMVSVEMGMAFLAMHFRQMRVHVTDRLVLHFAVFRVNGMEGSIAVIVNLGVFGRFLFAFLLAYFVLLSGGFGVHLG
jgi:hypothetical protein